MGIAAKIFSFSRRQSSTPSSYDLYSSLYPEAIRYALSYKAAQMGKEEMTSLVHRYPYEASYLVTKALAYNRAEQVAYFNELTCLFHSESATTEDFQHLLARRIDALPEQVTVAGAKLAQLSRFGSQNWQNKFRTLVEDCYVEDPRAIPCIVAYTPMIAYHHFVEVYRQTRHARLTIIVPEWMMDADEPNMGYEISLKDSGECVRLQSKDECLNGTWHCLKHNCSHGHVFCRNCFFIDDTINTAATYGKVRSFWKSEYGLQIPDERIRVITDLRHN